MYRADAGIAAAVPLTMHCGLYPRLVRRRHSSRPRAGSPSYNGSDDEFEFEVLPEEPEPEPTGSYCPAIADATASLPATTLSSVGGVGGARKGKGTTACQPADQPVPRRRRRFGGPVGWADPTELRSPGRT